MYVSQALLAATPATFADQGDLFVILAATTANLTAEFYRAGRKVSEVQNVGAGYSERFTGDGFDTVVITSATAQTVQFVTRQGNEVVYNTPPVGNVSVTNTAGAFVQAQKTVTTTSGTLQATKSNRRYLLIQNNDQAGDIWVNLAGGTATSASGVRIPPGGSLELQGYVPNGSITAIGSLASNANIVTVEG